MPFFNKIKHTYIAFGGFLAVVMFGCLDRVDVPLRQETRQLVVEGGVTNDSSALVVRLSFTRQFGDATNISPVRGAVVSISDDANNTLTLRASPTDVGAYSTPSQVFLAQAGRSYKLNVKLSDGREYESLPEKMPQAVPISKLSAAFDQVSLNRGYKIFAEAQDPKNTPNYYRWTAWSIYLRKSTGVRDGFDPNSICCDRCWLKEINESPNLLSDATIDGGVIRNRQVMVSPFYFYGAHYVEVKQHAMTKGAYQFWQRYQEQLQRTGSIFDPIPAAILGNVINKNNAEDVALGYFSATAIAKKRLVIPDTLAGKVPLEPNFIGEGDCARVYPYAIYNLYAPPGW